MSKPAEGSRSELYPLLDFVIQITVRGKYIANLPTLKYRRIRGYMIEVYKMFSGRYDVTVTNWFTNTDTVVSANTIDTFKARLDRFWSDQEVKYNWKSDIITGSRSQVSVIIE